jgi:hypothetical protein
VRRLPGISKEAEASITNIEDARRASSALARNAIHKLGGRSGAMLGNVMESAPGTESPGSAYKGIAALQQVVERDSDYYHSMQEWMRRNPYH